MFLLHAVLVKRKRSLKIDTKIQIFGVRRWIGMQLKGNIGRIVIFNGDHMILHLLLSLLIAETDDFEFTTAILFALVNTS